MKTKLIVTAIMLGAFFTTAHAQTIKQKNKNERHRITNGVKSGELTKAETKNLAHSQREIHKDAKAAKADGVVTKEERKNIKKEQRHQSRKIYRKKNNSRDRK